MSANKEVNVRSDGKTLYLSRQFDAAPELVFEAFSDCEHISQWWAPKGWSVTYCEMDFRPGGKWHYCMSSDSEEMESWGLATYEEITKPDSIHYTDQFADKDGTPNSEMPLMKITVRFTGENGITTLESQTEFESEEELQKILEMGVVEGQSSAWDKLDMLLAEKQA